jgi:hypothetical protein
MSKKDISGQYEWSQWTPFHQKNLWYLLFIINIKISPEKKILNVIYTILEQLTNNNTIITVNKINTFLGTVSIINISDKHITFQYNSQFV